MIWLIDRGQSNKNEVMTVVAESHPHLKLGAIRDFKNIMIEHGYWEDNRWNESNHTYIFPNKSVLEFISFDKFGKAHGPRRDILFLNEANNLEYNIADQLITRTKKIVWMDWNPTSEFWFYEEMLNKRDDLDFITLTYKDCINALDQVIIDEIESHKHNKNWWQVYGLGQLGEIEGRIYTGWQIIDELPEYARLERYGLDFGYSNDPTAVVAIYYCDNRYILDEELYRKGMSNKDIVDNLKQIMPDKKKDKMIVADSAEPKSIDEIKAYGINMQPCKKGRDSVRSGIQLVQDQPISITKRSVNLIKEYRNYLWATDKDGKYIQPNEPIKGNDHLLDCLVKGTIIKTLYGNKPIEKIKKDDLVYTRDSIQRVKDSWMVNKRAEVRKLKLSDGRELIGTKNHRVWTKNRGWQLLTHIRYGDIMEVWKLKENTKTEHTSFTPILNNGQKENIFIMAENFCIGVFGKTILEKYPKVLMCTTKIVIHLIIVLETLNWWRKVSIANYITRAGSQLLKTVQFVVKNLNVLLGVKKTSFAQTNVKVNGGEIKDWIMLKENASGAKMNLKQTNMDERDFAPVYVVQNILLKKRQEVYDITVEKQNEYFANGILVHNSLRYGMETLGRLKQELPYWDRVFMEHPTNSAKKFNKER